MNAAIAVFAERLRTTCEELDEHLKHTVGWDDLELQAILDRLAAIHADMSELAGRLS